MKGYSFQELVKLAEAAVKRAGDIMTGDLTAPRFLMSSTQSTAVNASTRKDYVDAELAEKLNLTGGTLTGNLTAPAVLVSSAQNTSVNALTRKDYVDSAIAAGDALRVSKTGDTMTGNLTAPKVLLSGSQGAEANAATRKDYVDTELAKKLSLAGDTMTGNLTIATGAPILCLHEVDTTKMWFLVADGYGARFQPDSPGTENSWSSGPDGTFTCKNPHSQSPQGSNAGSLTRKDYVDGEIAKQVSKSGDTMTGKLQLQGASSQLRIYDTDQPRTFDLEVNTGTFNIVDVDNTSVTFGIDSDKVFATKPVISYAVQSDDPNALTRMDYVNAENAKKLSLTGGTLTGGLTVDTHLAVSGVSASVGLTANGSGQTMNFGNSGGIFFLEHPGVKFPILYNQTNYALYLSDPRAENVQVYSPDALTRKDYVDAQVATRAPTTHNHTAAQGNSDIVAGSYGQIGTYGFFYNLGTEAPVGTQRSGSTLCWSGARSNSTANINPSGTWKCVGHARPNGASEGEACTLWIRVA